MLRIGLCYMMEYEGDIVRVDRKRGHGFSLTMFRYNAIPSSWEKFNNNDDDVMLKDISFLFLQPYCYHCFCAKATKEDGPLKKKLMFFKNHLRCKTFPADLMS